MKVRAAATLLACLAVAGCATECVEMDARHPALRYSESGVYFEDRRVAIEDVPSMLERRGVPRDSVIHIRLDPGTKDLRGARLLMAHVAKAGYTRPVLVTERHAESVVTGKKPKVKQSRDGRANRAAPVRGKVRYKRATE